MCVCQHWQWKMLLPNEIKGNTKSCLLLYSWKQITIFCRCLKWEIGMKISPPPAAKKNWWQQTRVVKHLKRNSSWVQTWQIANQSIFRYWSRREKASMPWPAARAGHFWGLRFCRDELPHHGMQRMPSSDGMTYCLSFRIRRRLGYSPNDWINVLTEMAEYEDFLTDLQKGIF